MIILISKRNNKFQTCYCYTLKKTVQIKKMLAERGWDNARPGVPNLGHFPGIEGIQNLAGDAKDLAGKVLKATRTRLFPQPVLPSTYPEDLQQYAELLTWHGFSPDTLVPQEKGITVSKNGKLIIHWQKRAIEPRI